MRKLFDCINKQRRLRPDAVELPRAWSGPNVHELGMYRVTTRLISHTDASFGVELLRYLSTSSGYFPFQFLSDIAADKKSLCLQFLCREMVSYVLRKMGLERVFQCLLEIRYLVNVDMALSYITNMLCCVLNCERASFWMVDHDRNIAWTKILNATLELSIPLDTGFVGDTYQTRAVVNVEDAYQDDRFNRAGDRKTGFRTKTVLCVPILKSKCRGFKSKKKDDSVLAVLQVINKKDAECFDSTDIFMLTTLGYGMTEVVLDCETEELNLRAHLRKDTLLGCTWEILLNCYGMQDLVRILNYHLGKMFQSLNATLSLAYTDRIARYEYRGKELVVTELPRRGLVGECLEKCTSIHVRDVSIESRYDPKVDLDVPEEWKATFEEPFQEGNFSLHCMPLKRGKLMSAVVQWVCARRSKVDFGDDGLFNQNNPRHFDLLAKMLHNVQMLVEKWHPTINRISH